MTRTRRTINSVSVIIPNLNCPILDQALEALYAQSLPPDIDLEVIVIGQDEYGHLQRFPQVTSIYTPDPVPPGTARNIGIRHSRGQLIVCQDADCVAQPNWLSELIAAHQEHPQRTVIGGSIRITADNYWALADNLSSFHAYLPSRPSVPYPVLPTCNVSMRREAFDTVGWFDDALVYDEDADWMMRARQEGFTLRFHSPAVVWHRTQRKTFRSAISHAYVWGNYSIITRHRYQELQSTPFILKNWWALLLLSPFIATGVTARIYLRNPSVWRHVTTAPVIFLAKMAWCWGAVKRLREKSPRSLEEGVTHVESH